MKRILQYPKGTVDQSLRYKKLEDNSLSGYLVLTGVVFQITDTLHMEICSWLSKKLAVLGLSTSEAE